MFQQVCEDEATTDEVSDIKELESLQCDESGINMGGGSNGHTRLPPHSPNSTLLEPSDGTLESQSDLSDGRDPTKMPPAIEAVLRGSWPFENPLWHSSPASMGVSYNNGNQVS